MSEHTPSRIPVWLIISLIVNALLIGLILGGGLAKRKVPGGGGPQGSEMHLARGIESVISPEEREVLRKALRSAFTQTREERREVRAARLELRNLLGSEVYDIEAVKVAFARLRDADSGVKVALHDELAVQLEKLTVEQRQKVLQRVDRRPRGPHPRNGNGPRRDGERPPRDRNGSPPRD